MTDRLQHLIAEARGLANDHPCVHGHTWVTEGGRACPRGSGSCSQAVYRCARCGDYDYGEPGGPGWEDCQRPCHWTCGDADGAAA